MDVKDFIEALLEDGMDDSTIIDFVETQNSEIVELRANLAAMDNQAPCKWERLDKNYSTEDYDVAYRWINKGLPIRKLYAKPVPAEQVPDAIQLLQRVSSSTTDKPAVTVLAGALERIANMDSMSYHSPESAKIVARNALAAHAKETSHDNQ